MNAEICGGAKVTYGLNILNEIDAEFSKMYGLLVFAGKPVQPLHPLRAFSIIEYKDVRELCLCLDENRLNCGGKMGPIVCVCAKGDSVVAGITLLVKT
jgi:hypothetical protein